jgi:hypothetical protein
MQLGGRASFAKLREYEFFSRWRSIVDNGKRPLRHYDDDEEDGEDEPNKCLALSSSFQPTITPQETSSPIPAPPPSVPSSAETLSDTHLTNTIPSQHNTVEAVQQPAQKSAVPSSLPVVEDAMPFWMALMEPNPDLDILIAIAQMDPLNDPLGFVVDEVEQEVTDYGFLDLFDSAP